MNIQEYINLYFKRFPGVKYMILRGDLTGGSLIFNKPILNPSSLNDFEKNPVLKNLLKAPKSYIIISKYNEDNIFYNIQVFELKLLQLGFGVLMKDNLNFYMTESENLFGNIILTKEGTFKVCRYNNINFILDYADCDIIALKLFEKETGIHLD
jgi:hypothetical protein